MTQQREGRRGDDGQEKSLLCTPNGSPYHGEPQDMGVALSSAAIFADLAPLAVWIPWKWEVKEDGTRTKRPHDGVNGLSTKNPAHRHPLGSIKHLIAEKPELGGIGIVMTGGIRLGDKQLVAFDYDHIEEGFQPLFSGYAERSPSGTGARAFAWAPSSWGALFEDTWIKDYPRADHVEVYLGTAARFLTVTLDGNGEAIPTLSGDDLVLLGALLRRKDDTSPTVPVPIDAEGGSVVDLTPYAKSPEQMAMLRGEPCGDRSKRLRGILIRASNKGVSPADQAATIIDNEHLWKYCLDHRNGIDAKAVEFARQEVANAYAESIPGKRARLFGKQEPPKAPIQPPTPPDLTFPMELYRDAPGLVGEIARWIIGASYSPREEFAYACALSMVACLIGPYCTVGTRGSKLNLYLCLVGGSGTGKNEAFDTMGKLLAETEAKDVIQDFPASEAALRRQLSITPNILIRADELAHKVESMQGNSNGAGLFRVLLDAYNGERLPPKVYANEKNSLPAVENPYVQIISGTTNKVWDVLTTTQADDGTLNRIQFVCLPDEPPYSSNPEPGITVGKEFKDRLNKFWRDGKRYDLMGYVPPGYGRRIKLGDDVREALEKLKQTAYEKTQTIKDFPAIFSRQAQNTMKVAAVLAVGDGRLEVMMNDFHQAKQFVEWCLENTYRKCAGGLGSDLYEKLSKAFMQAFDAKSLASQEYLTERDIANFGGRPWRSCADGNKKESVIRSLTMDGKIEVNTEEGKRRFRRLL